MSWVVGAVSGLIAAAQSVVAHREATKAERNAKRAQQELQTSVTTLEKESQPSSLDEELGEISTALTANVARLYNISERAKAFEVEVRALVDKAEVAKAAAALHEEDAKKIATLLGAETQARLSQEIDRLAEAHARQIEALKKSSNRTAWATFVAGAIMGFGVNILTTWMMS